MRLLVYEFASGEAAAGRDVPASLRREGSAMLAALVGDLAGLGHQVVTTLAAMDGVDAVWLVAPETDRCHERLAATAVRRGARLVGCAPEVVAAASDKARLPGVLAGAGISHPRTRVLRRASESTAVSRDIGFPLVVKPARGAGSGGVRIVRDERALADAVASARAAGSGFILLQEYVAGTPVSVSLIADGIRAVPLSLNRQSLKGDGLSYEGGQTPFEHRLGSRAITAALDACRACPGLRGFVGVDLVLTDCDAVVIEINPRLTTAYLGVRAAVDENVAALVLAACDGRLPAAPVARRRVRFLSSGQIVASEAIGAERGAA